MHSVHTYGTVVVHVSPYESTRVQMRGEYIGLMYQVPNGVVGHALFWMSNEEFIN